MLYKAEIAVADTQFYEFPVEYAAVAGWGYPNLAYWEFYNKNNAEAMADEYFNYRIATQIRILRLQRGWSQKELAEKARMAQSRISAMENVKYNCWTLSILERLAWAFDVGIGVSFEAYSAMISDRREVMRNNSKLEIIPRDQELAEMEKAEERGE